MKAIVCKKYGPPEVLQLKDMAITAPRNNEILKRVFPTAVNSADWRLRKADPWAVRISFDFTKPRKQILGGVFSGEIVVIGNNVTRFKMGDQIFGFTGVHFDAYVEFNCLPEDGVLSIMPDTISYNEASTILFGGTTALYFLKKTNIMAGQKVLIDGASAAVINAAVQPARYFGAEVTGVCSGTNVEMVKTLGADKVIDENTGLITKAVSEYEAQGSFVQETPVAKKKYVKSGLSIEQAASIHKELTQLMVNKKLFEESELKLSCLANTLSIHPNYLSQVINEKEGKNFYDYINSLRIEEFKRLITLPESKQYTILGLAYACGFNSKSSFNRYFKKVTSLSPSEYIQNNSS